MIAMRKAAGLSQRQLARRLSTQPSWVAKVETGERRLDLIEFCWVCHACKASPQKIAEALFEEICPPGGSR